MTDDSRERIQPITARILIILVILSCALIVAYTFGPITVSVLPDGWDKMTALEKYHTIKAIEERQAIVWRQQQAIAEAQHRNDIMAVLNERGVDENTMWTNGYIYEFALNNTTVSFCDQDDRIVGELYRTPSNSSETEMLEDAHTIMSDAQFDAYDGLDNTTSTHISAAERIVSTYGYREFIIDGYPSVALKELIRTI
jgi:hypothetical protein